MVVCLNDFFLDDAAPRVLLEDQQYEVQDQDEATNGAESDACDSAGGRRAVDAVVGGGDSKDVLLAPLNVGEGGGVCCAAAEAVVGDGGGGCG